MSDDTADPNHDPAGDSTGDDDPTKELLAHFTSEYGEALRAFETIRAQSETLLLMGGGDDLRNFLEQFIGMAERTRDSALENDQPIFAEWFGALIKRAEDLGAQITAKDSGSSH